MRILPPPAPPPEDLPHMTIGGITAFDVAALVVFGAVAVGMIAWAALS